MNIKKMSLGGNQFALVNFDNVTEVHERVNGGCDIYFNSMATEDEQAYIKVKESLSDIEALLNKGNTK